MDSSTLRRLGEGGFDAVRVSQFPDLAAWCQDWCQATGDGRYCILARVLGMIDEWWSDQGVPEELGREVERTLTSKIPAIIEAESPASGAAFAVGLREEIASLLLTPAAWVERGYAEPSGGQRINPGPSEE